MRKTLHEFVIEQTEDEKAAMLDDNQWEIYRYAKLTNRAPKLSDFVPCNEGGKPITLSERGDKPEHERVEEHNKYQKALDKVIFDGDWECLGFYGDVAWIQLTDGSVNIHLDYNRIEDLPKEITFKDGAV